MKLFFKDNSTAVRLKLILSLSAWVLAGVATLEPIRADAANSCNLSLSADFTNLPAPVIVGGNALTVSRGTPGKTGFFTTSLPAQLNISGVTGSPVVLQVDDSEGDPRFKINNSGTIQLGKVEGTQTNQINSTQTVITSGRNFADLNIERGSGITGQLRFSSYSTSQISIGSDTGGGGLALGIPAGGPSPDPSSRFVIRGLEPTVLESPRSAILLIENADDTKLLTVTDDGRVGVGRNPDPLNRPLQGKAPSFNDPNRWPGAALEVNGPMQVSSGFVILTHLAAGANASTYPTSPDPCTAGSDSDGLVVLTANKGLCVCQVTSTAAKWLSARNGIASCVWN